MAFNGDIGQVLGSSASTDYDNEGYILAQASKTRLSKHSLGGLLKIAKNTMSLKAMVTMILRGLNIDQVDNPYFNQATLTMSQ